MVDLRLGTDGEGCTELAGVDSAGEDAVVDGVRDERGVLKAELAKRVVLGVLGSGLEVGATAAMANEIR